MRRLTFLERHENFWFFCVVAVFLAAMVITAVPAAKGWYDCHQAGGVYVRAMSFPTGHECIEEGRH